MQYHAEYTKIKIMTLIQLIQFRSVQSLSRAQLFATLWTAAHQGFLSITNSQSLLKLMSIESVIPSNHPTISSAVVPFSSCLQSFPASGSFPVSWFFASGGQSVGIWASASVFPMNIQHWLPLGWTGWLSLQSKGISRVFSNNHSSKASILPSLSFLYTPTLTSTYDYWKNHSFD